MNISERDQYAIEYTKHSALLTGDTLVIIKYPNNQPAFDAYGFQLKDLHRVHSEKLLATNSKVFKEKLESEWLQHRAAKKAGVLNNLPDGIRYVIDLTPPEEGDDALQLTAELCCSEGIREWHTSQFRLGVARNLVAGRDESSTRRDPISQPNSPRKANVASAYPNPPYSELSTAVSSIINGETSGADYRGVIPDKQAIGLHVAFDLPNSEGGTSTKHIETDVDFTGVTELWSDAKFGPEPFREHVLDYCPIRHRAGIERLLQVVEDREPRLDSATKIWTLAVLAKYFDCAKKVTDYIATWVVAEPNCRFMEVLPETTFKLGMMLECHALARAGFSILVSEEALRVGESKYFQEIDFKYKGRQHSKSLTRFGRVREDLDDDFLNIVQHAARSLSARIEKTLGDLLDVKWMETLPEFAKLRAFEEHLNALDESGPYSSHIKDQKSRAESLIGYLRDYVRGRIVYCLVDSMSYQQAKDGTNHRIAERWQSLEGRDGLNYDHDVIYDSLSDFERMLTRNFWEVLRGVEWTTNKYSNRIRDNLADDNSVFYNRNVQLANKYGIDYVNMRDLENGTREVNLAMRDTTLRRGVGPVPSTFDQPTPAQSTIDEMTEKLSQLDADTRIDNPTRDDWYEAEECVNGASQMTSRDRTLNYVGHETIAQDTTYGVPRFSLYEFLQQVKRHVGATCNTMLMRGKNDWSVLCPTLLCLSEEEYKFLPLFAGGMNDGSGGVFEEEIPPAEKGPAGPGPAFHTGSTANSLASELDFDGRSSTFDTATMDGIQTSLGVEDGFSDHLDRRAVYSEDDFPIEHGSIPVDSHARDGPTTVAEGTLTVGDAAGEGQNVVTSAESGGAPPMISDVSHIDRDDFFNTGEDEDEGDFDMDDSESEGTVTED